MSAVHPEGFPALPPRVGERYAIQRRLGSGGMATVYLACDQKHNRNVALKVMHPDLARVLGSERFLREIGILAQLTHPHILPLHDSGEADGVLYFVMPYVEGDTLRDRLSREPQLSLRVALEITCQVASALEHAHRNGILHRDIKPENILLEDGHAVVSDFGIARAIGASEQGLTATGMMLGTPAYMSPEQAVGESELDGRSDIYSLACVLYEMLAGAAPFTGESAQSVIGKRLSGPPPRIRKIRPSVPKSVEQTLVRALAPIPADRYPTAGDFRAALAACRDREPAPGPRGLSRRAMTVTVTAGGAILLTLFWVVQDRYSPPTGPTTIAILPLTNTSSDPEHAYLAEGLTDAVIADLLATPRLRVISRGSAMRYASMGGMAGGMGGGMSVMGDATPSATPRAGVGTGKSPREIARELGADMLLQGKVEWENDSVAVSATLTRSGIDKIWEQRIVRHGRELFLLQRDLLQAITRAIRRDTRDRTPPAPSQAEYDPAAHEAYLKGSYYQAHWKLPQAIAAFERAVELDPAHAPAQAGLARAYYFLAFFGEIPPSLALGGMRRAAESALQRDSLLAEAHGQMALVEMLQEWDWEGAERHFRRALELSPGHAQIRHDYAHFLLALGRQAESLRETEQAVALDPVNPMLISCLGWHALFDGNHREAARYAVEANALMPDHWAHVVLGWALIGQGQPDSALQSFREAHRLSQTAFTLAALGYGLAVSGNAREARRVLTQLLERLEKAYVSPYDIATVYAGLGDADESFKWLRRAAEERSTFVVHLGWDSRFDRLRKDPRLAELVTRELKLPARQPMTVATAARPPSGSEVMP